MFKRAPLFLVVSVAFVFASPCSHADDPERATIIDLSEDTREHSALLAQLGDRVFGRYYSRCPQWKTIERKQRIVPDKRMIDNPGEVDMILGDAQLAMLSVYQFYSQEGKFDSNRSSGPVLLVDDRPRLEAPKTVADFNDCITPDRPNTIEEDARLDAYAAITQASKLIKQPTGTAIYFGVDFNLTDDRRKNVYKYFNIVSKLVTDAGYKVGVYGNGAIGDYLFDNHLVDFVWLTASSSHQGSANTYNKKHWDLLQTKTDTRWLLKKGSNGHPDIVAELDTNIQNPDSTFVGFWKRSGAVSIDHDRNVAIHKARYFVCEGSPTIVDDAGSALDRPFCTKTFGLAVRAFKTDTAKKLIQVDCNEDGVADGWMKVGDLSVSRPIWVDDTADRLKTHCSGH